MKEETKHKKNSIKASIRWRKLALDMLLKLALLLFFIWLTSTLSSCIDDKDVDTRVERVLLVYLAGDNNLSREAYQKLDALAQGFDGAGCRRILVYMDTQMEVPQLIELSRFNKQTILYTFPEENSADPAVFRRVIGQARSLYPEATHNLLVFSHATGWLPGKSYTSLKTYSILMDQKQVMELAELASAIPDGAFESIVFETCLMAGIEVFYELRHKAKYIAGSSAEIVSPGFTPIYSTSATNELVKGNLLSFMEAAFAHFDAQSGIYRSATLSVVETSQMEKLADFIKNNTDLSKEVAIGEIQGFDREVQYQKKKSFFFDFEDYYSRLLQAEAKPSELNELLDQTVIWKKATPSVMEGFDGFVVNKHSGITTYIPQEQYPQLNPAYKDLSWYKAISSDKDKQSINKELND